MTFRNFSLIFLSIFIFTSCGGGGGDTTSSAGTSTSAYEGSTSTDTTSSCTPSTTNLCITVSSSRKYVLQNTSAAGESQKTLTLNTGTYVFDQTASSNSGHPMRISTTSDGTHGGGTEYATGYSYDGTPGTDGKLTLVITNSTPTTLYYYCSVHSGMGGIINILLADVSEQVEFTETIEDAPATWGKTWIKQYLYF